MSEFIRKVPGWLVVFIAQLIIGAVVTLHTFSVKANIRDELKSYVTKEEAAQRERSHGEWIAEAVKRMDGKIDDVVQRLRRIEDKL